MAVCSSVQRSSIPYQSSWPRILDPSLKSTIAKLGKIFWNLLSIIVFPIGLYRLFDGWVRHRIFKIIVPGSPDKSDFTNLGLSLLKEHQGQSLTLLAPDGAKLNGAFFPGKEREKVIIFISGNCSQWELLEDQLIKLKQFGTSVLFLNHRGVGESEGLRYDQGYSLDVYAAYDYLIKKEGIDPENILAIGQSWGAATTTLGAGLVQEEYPNKKIKVINDRSFSNLQTEIQALLAKSGLLGFIGRIASRVIGFDFDVTPAFEKLKGKKAIFYHPEDEIIPLEASLFTKMKNSPKIQEIDVYEMHDSSIFGNSHNRTFNPGEQKFFNSFVTNALNLKPIPSELTHSS